MSASAVDGYQASGPNIKGTHGMTENTLDLLDNNAMLTKEHWELFQKEFKKWVNIFGLKRYNLVLTFRDEEDGNIATCCADNGSMMAWINLHSSACCAMDATDNSIKRVAFHEAAELLLWDINCMLSQFFSHNVVQSKLHQVIIVLENMMFEEKNDEDRSG